MRNAMFSFQLHAIISPGLELLPDPQPSVAPAARNQQEMLWRNS